MGWTPYDSPLIMNEILDLWQYRRNIELGESMRTVLRILLMVQYLSASSVVGVNGKINQE